MESIERELCEAPPGNSVRISRNELCRRARIGLTTLKNPTHRELAEEVRDWIKRLNDSGSNLRSRKRGASELVRLKDEYRQLASNLHRFKIEYDALQQKHEALQRELADLRRSQLKVIPITK